jgi:hypothetical protein
MIMRSIASKIAVASLCAAVATPALSAPVPGTGSALTFKSNAAVQDVQYKKRNFREGRRFFRHRNRRRNRNVGSLFLGTVAGLIIANAIRENRARDSDMQACADRYRSFDWDTGTYVGYDGERHVCPYLY